jgi:hypothetical protein
LSTLSPDPVDELQEKARLNWSARCRDAGIGNRTDGGASRRIVMALALLTFVRVDRVDIAGHADGLIRTFELAGATGRAEAWDDHVGHG